MDIAFSTIELKDDTIIVVLGASGDLAKKKTVRAPPSWIPMTPTNKSGSSPHYSVSYVCNLRTQPAPID